MGYRDELIERLRDAGAWEGLTVQEQRRFQDLTDDQARQLMVMDDAWEMGDDDAVQVMGVVSLVRMMTSFKGALVEHEGERKGRLSQAGALLAEFFLQLQKRGLSPDEIDQGLRELHPLVISALLAAHKGSQRGDHA
jgi:hypothetical protein